MDYGIYELKLGPKVFNSSKPEHRLKRLSWIEAIHYNAREFHFHMCPLGDGQADFKIEGESLLVEVHEKAPGRETEA